MSAEWSEPCACQASGDACAFPHAFARPSRGGTPGCWWHLLPTAAGLADSDRLVRQAVRTVFTLSQTQALPLACRQSLWLLHAGGLPVGPRTGGSGLCPVTDAMRAAGHTMGRAAETHEQIAMHSPTARLVWRHVAAAWRAFCPGHSWPTSAAQDGRPRRAMTPVAPSCLGCGLMVNALCVSRSRCYAAWRCMRSFGTAMLSGCQHRGMVPT